MAVKHAILVGVGGQGAILTAKVLVSGLMKAGYDVKMSEVHGMSQRGGSVSTQVHWGEKVYSPLIGPGAADVLVAFEKMEAVRYASFLKPEGVAVINDYEQASATIAAGLAEYPAGCLEAMQANFKCYTLDAAQIAEELGNAKCMNIVLFGALTHALGMEDIDWEEIIRETVPPKFLELNLKAYRADAPRRRRKRIQTESKIAFRLFHCRGGAWANTHKRVLKQKMTW